MKLANCLSHELKSIPVAQSVECPLRGTECCVFDPGRDIPKSLKMVLVALAWHSDLDPVLR